MKGRASEGTKTDKHRTVPLVPQAVAALAAHRDGKRSSGW
jgi:hypothetical protein